jgi:hypothetical protein
MLRLTLSFSVAALLALSLISNSAQAQSRVFVAAQGSDSNPCSFAAPCRTFQHAHDAVAAGGEIDVLDPAGYGALVINKGISIQGHGFSGISVSSGGTGISISVPSTDNVSLNGLLIDGGGAGNTGILFSSGRSLSIANCVARNFTHSGLDLANNGSVSLALAVSNSYFADNAANGIVLEPNGTGNVVASIDRTVLSGNGVAGLSLLGQTATGQLFAAVSDSIAVNNFTANNPNVGAGFLVQSTSGHFPVLGLTHASAIGNTTGLVASGTGATLVAGQSTVRENGQGFSVSGGVISSYGDNYIDNNFFGNAGSLTPATRQ